MALAYCILAHTNPAQIGRLLRAIWHPENLYILHYERRSSRNEHRALCQLAEEYSNVSILASQAVLWGRYSQVAVQLEALAELVHNPAPWTHFINLTGQDFPLKPQEEIVRKLGAMSEKSFVSSFDPFVGCHWQNTKDRLERIHIDWPFLETILGLPGIGRRLRNLFGWTNKMPFIPLLRRKPPKGFKYIGGSNHVILSRAMARYVITDRQAHATKRWLRWTGHPDETLYQTTLLNSVFAKLIVNDDLRAVFWGRHGDPSPSTLALVDLDRLKSARDAGKLFARKFDMLREPELLNLVERDFLIASRN